MSTHNICFHQEIRKLLSWYPLLSRPMAQTQVNLHICSLITVSSLFTIVLSGQQMITSIPWYIHSSHCYTSDTLHPYLFYISPQKHIIWISMCFHGEISKDSLDNPSYLRGYITKTCLYNTDPLKPHFYIVKLGFTGVYIIFVISAQKHRLWVLVSTHNLCFEQKYEKYQNFLCEKLPFFGGKIFSVFE